jgi:plasmid stability protein
MLEACYRHDMANLQVKNVPDDLFRKIRRHAEQEGRTIRDFVLEAVRAKIAREEFAARLRKRTPVQLDRPVAQSIADVRDERDRELGR